MDELNRLLKDVETLMEMQIQGMADFEETQVRAKKALEEKNWLKLEQALASLEFKTEGLHCLEERRCEAWKKIQRSVADEEASFYVVLPRLPAEWREKISSLHRDLKIQTLRLKGLTMGISAYVQTAGTLIRGVIQEINPAFRGRLYSKNGFLKASEAQSLVLNAHM